MLMWKVLLWDRGRQARAKMRDGWPGTNCHQMRLSKVCFFCLFLCSLGSGVVGFWLRAHCVSMFSTTDFSTRWVLETRWLMKFALVRTASCSILSNWLAARKTPPTILPGGITPSARRLWILSWTGSENWPIIAPVGTSLLGVQFWVEFSCCCFNA